MAEEILINITPREVRVALLDNGVLQEVHIERSLHQGLIGNIYKGKVTRLLPGIQAAFVDIGLERAAFLHISDLMPVLQQHDADIRDFLRPGQEILVQVYKDPLGSKGARLTTQFSIPSRYLVFTPGMFDIAISQKIVEEAEKQRLLTMITPNREGGFIFRTAAVGANQSDIDVDKEFLATLWADISARAKQVKSGGVVYEEIPIVLRVLRDLVGYHISRIRIDDQAAVNQMRDFAKRYVPDLVERIEHYTGDRPIFDIYSVEDELQKALLRKVYLKSGGYLVFDQTEAMTTIDVNTGSYIGQNKLEETIYKTNLEAVSVIARQVRLRNIGGIIIIDFIDMSEADHKAQLLQMLTHELAKDSARTEISELSSLGLVQMTRKRTRESLEHVLCVTCPLCQRRGLIKSAETVCYEIFREIKRIAENYPWPGFLIVASNIVINRLLEEESTMLADLELQLNRPIKWQVDPLYVQEDFEILPMTDKE